jgi:hypothetical protein
MNRQIGKIAWQGKKGKSQRCMVSRLKGRV